ncbi:MAG: glutathione S-transferase family protein [Alphaproteobacteria bacterium]|nr:glutathione S-transferase family protein [Alphaproteobacteria bacterium]
MTVTLYDLAGADPARRFSPYCWRIRMALAHKGLDVDARPWRFTEKDAIAFSGQGLVPVIVDGGRVVADSWEIARYLEAAYPDRPSLFAGAVQPIRFIASWTDRVVQPQIGRMIIADVAAILDDKDRAYFRDSREKRFGAILEAVQADRDQRLAPFRQSLEPIRVVLSGSPWLGGEAPSFADYAVFGAFQWARCSSPFRLLAEDDPIFAWHRRVRRLFDGLADQAPAFD